MTKSEKDKVELILNRIEGLEELTRILALNSLSTQADIVYHEKDCNAKYEEIMEKFHVLSIKENIINGKEVCIVDSDYTRIADFRIIKDCFVELYPEKTPVFIVKKFVGNQRNKFEKEKISYILANSEIRIFFEVERVKV